jgi:hypothetical protein
MWRNAIIATLRRPRVPFDIQQNGPVDGDAHHPAFLIYPSVGAQILEMIEPQIGQLGIDRLGGFALLLFANRLEVPRLQPDDDHQHQRGRDQPDGHDQRSIDFVAIKSHGCSCS